MGQIVPPEQAKALDHHPVLLPGSSLPSGLAWAGYPERARPVLRGDPVNAPGLPEEVYFSVITRQAIRRGSFRSVKGPTTEIGASIDTWNQHPRPFRRVGGLNGGSTRWRVHPSRLAARDGR